MTYELFIKVREKYIDQQYDQGKILDQNLFLLSTGAFGVTFGFISSVVKYPNPRNSWFLVLSWSLIATCIIVSLVNYFINHFQYARAREEWEEKYDKHGRQEVRHEMSKTKPRIEIATILNVVSISLLASGFVFLLIYVGVSFNTTIFV